MWPTHQQRLMLQHSRVKKKMHLQEYTLFDLDLQVKVTKYNPVSYTLCDLCTYRNWSYYIKMFRRRCIYKKLNIWPWPWGQGHTKCCPVPSTSCDLFSYKVWSCYVKPFRKRYIYKKKDYLIIDLDLGLNVTRNVAQYSLHHMTYSAKSEVATSHDLGGETFTRNVTDGRRTDLGQVGQASASMTALM